MALTPGVARGWYGFGRLALGNGLRAFEKRQRTGALQITLCILASRRVPSVSMARVRLGLQRRSLGTRLMRRSSSRRKPCSQQPELLSQPDITLPHAPKPFPETEKILAVAGETLDVASKTLGVASKTLAVEDKTFPKANFTLPSTDKTLSVMDKVLCAAPKGRE